MDSRESASPWDRETFTQKLQTLGMTRYHHLHPFHRVMNAGKLTRVQIRGWAANRFYYQKNIPIKDAAILSNCPDRAVRRAWMGRIRDHDGAQDSEGGIEAWLQLAQAAGLSREETLDERHVLPGVRFAVDAYVAFARSKPWPAAIASSLTELFAPDLMSQRLAAFERHYPWVASEGLEYFRKRLTQARLDSASAVELTMTHCTTRELQEEAVRGLSFKCDILWAMLDAIMLAYGAGAPASEIAPAPPSAPSRPVPAAPCEDAARTLFSPWSEGARPRLSRKARLKFDEVSGQAALLYPEGVLVLNPTGEAIVRLCDGSNTLDEIAAELAGRYKTLPSLIASDLVGYLERLAERRLIEVNGQKEGIPS
jgi:pyrroloquinoline-quinone synthase